MVLRPRSLFYRTGCTCRSKFLMHALTVNMSMLHRKLVKTHVDKKCFFRKAFITLHCGTNTAPVLAPRRPSSAYILQAWQSNSDSIWLCHVSLFDVEKRVACNPMTYVGNTIQGLWRDACLLTLPTRLVEQGNVH